MLITIGWAFLLATIWAEDVVLTLFGAFALVTVTIADIRRACKIESSSKER